MIIPNPADQSIDLTAAHIVIVFLEAKNVRGRMMSLSSRCLIGLVICLPLLLLVGCHKKASESGPQYIMLTFNNAVCEQNGSTDVIEISPNRAVVYQGAAILRQFEVRFASCPFAACPVSSPHGTSVNIGPPNPGMAGATFNYSGMTMNNESCSNGATLGIRIRNER